MNPLEKLNKLADFGVSQAFLDFVTRELLADPSKEGAIIAYCEEVICRYENNKYAKPKYSYSRVRGRSCKKTPFWK